MAARYAVANGNWSDAIWASTITGSAGSAATPTNADDVTIIGQKIAVTVSAATDIITSAGHGLSEGDPVTFVADTLPAPLSFSGIYYARDITTDTFKVSSINGGTAVNITSDGSNVYVSKLNTSYTVNVDSTSCVCRTLNIASHGTLSCITTADTLLTVELAGLISSSGLMDIDMRTSDYTFTIVFNNSGNGSYQLFDVAYGGHIRLRGKEKLAWTKLDGTINAGATSCTVDAATGWNIGDEIILAPTETNFNTGNGWTPRYDRITLNGSYTPGSTTLQWDGGITYSHNSRAAVANLTRNIVFTSAGTGGKAVVRYGLSTSYYPFLLEISYFKIKNMATYPSPAGSLVMFNTSSTIKFNKLSGNVYDDASLSYYSPQYLSQETWSVYTRTASSLPNGRVSSNVLAPHNGMDDCCFIAAGYASNIARMVTGSRNVFCGNSWTSTNSALGSGGDSSCRHSDYEFYANQLDIDPSYAMFPECYIVSPIFGEIAPSYRNIHSSYAARIKLVNPMFVQTNQFNGGPPVTEWSRIEIINKNGDTNIQEVYTSESGSIPTIQRDLTEKKNSDASLKLLGSTFGAAERDIKYDIQVGAGNTVVIKGSCKVDADFYNGGDWYPPTVRFFLSTTEITANVVNYTATSAASSGWEDFTVSLTNTSGSTKLYTMKLHGDNKGGSGFCWFGGIPTYPFVNSCRHYGYIFDEENLLRITDTLSSADEATATNYTGMSITWGASSSSVALTGNTTFQKLFDYHQAQACLNVGLALALTGAGVAGSPALFAQGNLTTTGYTLNGAGSMTMGAYTLTASLPWAYTYTGGTFAQTTTVPRFDGGTLSIGAAGTYTFNTGGDTTVSATPTAPGEYNLSSGAFNGTLTFNNPTAHAVTVSVPAGVTTATATPGVVTFVAPVLTLTVAANESLVGAEVRVYDFNGAANSLGDELAGGVESAAGATVAFTSVASGNTVWIQIMKAGNVEFGQSFTMPASSTTFTANLLDDRNA